MGSIIGTFETSLRDYCQKNGLSYDKVRKSPKCGDGKTRLCIQYVDWTNVSGDTYIDDSEPAEILLRLYRTKTTGTVIIEEGKNARKYLTI